MMTDRLREIFDDMLADEPPLRTNPDEAESAGRRLRKRHRTLWTVAGAALSATLVAAGPSLLPFGHAAAPYLPGAASADILLSEAPPSPAFSISPPTAMPSTEQLATTRHCPADIAPFIVDNRDGSVLPDPDRAAQAVVAAAVRIAPGEKILVNMTGRIETSETSPGVPQVHLVFDIGNERGYGSVNLQLIADKSGTPQERAESALDRTGECVDVQRRDYPDGSVAMYYPYGPPAQEAEVTHVWYFARAGYNMNIGVLTMAWSSSSDPNTTPVPSALPPLGYQPLSISQVMDLANVVAESG
jgi:hypothetical protein